MQGGVAASSKNFAKPPKQTQPERFPFLFSFGKPPRPRDQWMLRDAFLNRSATPPCGDARRGLLARFQFVHTFIDRPHRKRLALVSPLPVVSPLSGLIDGTISE